MSSLPTDHTTATVEVTMPQMGVSVAEGTVVLWHKQPGDRVQADETICEITTDKIDSEVPSPASGELVEILVAVEETVPVGTPLARIATGGSGGDAHPGGGPRADTPQADAESAARREDRDRDGAAAAQPEAPQEGARQHYSPVVQRIAKREGVDLKLVHGTGRGGRVRKQDVLGFLNEGRNAGGERETSPPLHIDSPYREEEQGATAPAPPPREQNGHNGVGHAPSRAVDDEGAGAPAGARLSRMRRTIAAHMVESLRTAAHCTSITEADMSRIEAARAELGLSYLPFVARCVIDALRTHPELNATLEGETLTQHREVHLGIAVSLGSDGLIVPIVHDAHELSHEGLARRIKDLARRARAGELEADDVRGGTFTITNPGGYGTIASTPIINQPQVAILDLEAVVKRPVVVTDQDGGESVGIRPMTNLCLSWDHRALDGALAAQFLGCVRDHIEKWSV